MKRISRYLVNKLLGGVAFGVGILLVWLFVFYLIASHTRYIPVPTSNENRSQVTGLAHNLDFSKLTTEEKIKMSSAIALAPYRRTKEGGDKVFIQEYLKIDPGTKLTYAVGDEVSGALSQSAASDNFGDGVVIFFVDSPTLTKMTATYENDVIYGFDKISIGDFRKLITRLDEPGAKR